MTTAHQATFPGFQFPNTTQIPNDVFDSLMPHLSGGELKVLLYICRRTFGFRKDSDRISLTQIAHGITTKAGRVLDHGTGLSKRHVINALNLRDMESRVGTKSPQGVVNASAPGVVHAPSPGVVNASAPTKQREQKKEEQKKAYDDVVARDLENFGMTKSAVTTLIQRYPAPCIREKLAMARELVAAGSALVTKNPVGWLRRAIEEDYKPPRNTERPTPASGMKRQERTGTPKEQHSSITPPVKLPQPDRQTERIWQQTVEHITNDLPSGETGDRLTGTMLLEVTETKAVIGVANPTALPWLERRLYGQIAKALKAVLGKDLDLQFIAAS